MIWKKGFLGPMFVGPIFFCCYFCIVNYQNSFVAFCRRYLPKREALLGQLWRYCITGGIAFVVDFGLFALFLYGLDFHGLRHGTFYKQHVVGG